jgi:cytochrome c-type biogenesis protein CcsB
MTAADLSNNLFVLTVMIYAVAMFTFAVAFALTKQEPDAVHRRAAAPEHAQAVELVMAGSRAPRWEPSVTGTPVADDSSPPSAARPSRSRGVTVRRAAVAVTALGWVIHLVEVASRGVASGRVPWGNMYEFSSAVSLVAVGIFLALSFRGDAARLGVFVLVPVVLYLGLAGTVLYTQAGPLQPVLNSYWLKIHVLAALTATGTLMVGGIVTVLLIVRRWGDARNGSSGVGFTSRLPDAVSLDRLERRIITLAFPIWTFAIVAGAIWAESAWGRYWGWDPKETWSFITWVIYAAYLHARATPSWRRSAQYFAAAGFVALVVNYYVVNLVINGLHSYAGV